MQGNNISLLGQTNAYLEQEISDLDQQILRTLAERVALLARRPIEIEKKDLWYDHNALKSARPVLSCEPENSWNEIFPANRLHCTGELARDWEMHLRRELFWGEQLLDDRVINPYFPVPYIYEQSDWGLSENRVGGSDGTAYTWSPAITDFNQVEQLKAITVQIDPTASDRLLSLASEVFGNILPARRHMIWLWTQGMTQELTLLRGMEGMMLDMVDSPQQVHRLMQFLQKALLAKIDFLEQNRLLILNNDGTYVGSGGFGWSHDLPQPDYTDMVRTKDLWGFAESQETVGISPRMFAEFILPYQVPILERFGLNCYGCCEPLEKRWKYVREIPRLRRVSVSPFADLRQMTNLLGDQYVLSIKPNPADLALDEFDEAHIRGVIREILHITRGCHVELILKDTHTIRGDASRVIRWVRIAREEIGAL